MQVILAPLIVGNKAKGRISKRVFQENKARQIFRKMNISYPLTRTRTFGYNMRLKKMLMFSCVSTTYQVIYPAGIYLFKVNNRNTRTRCEICSALQ